ncbi:hypothetical protein BpHYR1_042310 [Brachionus plicatilis]|uniref:Uncharacterized protein n=1 Tax=Brachionus plicatilis TaxID=10195 RepID=A0A3M7TAS6_BRAPC|nr:hypothetical protein BpHYR1_042310 [Brachionus plicatilis]
MFEIYQILQTTYGIIKKIPQYRGLEKAFSDLIYLCWAAAKPGRSERDQNFWRPGRRPKIWTAELAGQNIDGRPNVRPNLKRTAILAVRQNQRKFLTVRLGGLVRGLKNFWPHQWPFVRFPTLDHHITNRKSKFLKIIRKNKIICINFFFNIKNIKKSRYKKFYDLKSKSKLSKSYFNSLKLFFLTYIQV